MKGKIFTIEGLDGAGKSTQIDILTKRLEEENIKFKFIHFPMVNQGVYGSLIAEFLRGEFGELEYVHPKLVALLFAEDRNEHKQTLLDWLEEDYLIIMDRYVNSNIAFQCAKLENPDEKEQLKKWILDFEFITNQLPKQEASFFLNVPFSAIENSLNNKRTGSDRNYLEGKTDIHEASIELQKNVLQEYLKIEKEQENFFNIQCYSADGKWLYPTEIHAAIYDKIREFTPNWDDFKKA